MYWFLYDNGLRLERVKNENETNPTRTMFILAARQQAFQPFEKS